MKTIKSYNVLSYIPTYLIGVDSITFTVFVQTKMDYPQLLRQYTKRCKGITIDTQNLKSTHVDKVNQGSIKYILKQFCEQLIII